MEVVDQAEADLDQEVIMMLLEVQQGMPTQDLVVEEITMKEVHQPLLLQETVVQELFL
jgi:hypothetical protein